MNTRTATAAARQLACVVIAATSLGACAGSIQQTGTGDLTRLEQSAQQNASAANLSQLGVAYYNAQRYEDARTTLQKAQQAGSKDGNTALYLGLANEELKDFAGARAAYEQYVGTTSGNSNLRKNIQARIALVARQELKASAKAALQQEQLLAQTPPTPASIAVMPFTLNNISEEMQPLQTAMAEMIVTDLGFTSLKSIERVRVQSMIDEMKLTLGGVTSEETGARMGRLLRAEKVVQGQLTGTGGEQLSADAVVLNTVERTNGDPVNRQGALPTIFDLEKQLVFGILDAAKYPVTPAERDRINSNRSASLLAFLAYGRGLEAMDRGDYDAANASFKQATQIDPGFGAARVQSSQSAQLSNAAQTSTTELAVQITPPVAATTNLQQTIAADLNPSPAQTVVNQTTESNAQQTTTTAASERASPSTEATPAPTISQAKKATVIITVKNPTTGTSQARIPVPAPVRAGGGQ